MDTVTVNGDGSPRAVYDEDRPERETRPRLAQGVRIATSEEHLRLLVGQDHERGSLEGWSEEGGRVATVEEVEPEVDVEGEESTAFDRSRAQGANDIGPVGLERCGERNWSPGGLSDASTTRPSDQFRRSRSA